MKQIVLVIIAFFVLALDPTTAQDKEFSTRQQYYFEDYQKAEVYTKKQQKSSLKLNYNVILDEMHYIQNGRKLSIGNLKDIKFIKFDNELFASYKEEFYQVVYADDFIKVYLKLEPDLSVLHKPSEGAYGSTNETSSVSRMSAIEERTYFLTLLTEVNNSNQELTIPVRKRFYILRDSEISTLTKRNLYKLHPDSKREVKRYIKKEKISLKDEKDIQLLFEFCSEL